MTRNMKKLVKLGGMCLALTGMTVLAGCGARTGGEASKQESGASSILNDNVLRVAMECSYAPYNWTQPDDKNGAVPIADSSDFAYGYDVMMAQHIAKELGYTLEIVKLDWDSLVPAVQSGSVDCVIAGQSITSERMETVDFSVPYYYASVVTLVKKDSPFSSASNIQELTGAKITSQINTIWYDLCAPQIEGGIVLPAQETAPAALVALDSGACDVVITDMPTAMAALVAYPEFAILDFSGKEGDYAVSDEEVNIGISMQKGNAQLKAAIDGVLEKMSEADYSRMMNDAIAVQPLSN